MTKKKLLKKHTDKLTPEVDAAPVKVKVDESARLREIRELVKANNKSKLDDNLIICQIWMESSFNARAGESHDARGLMQMQTGAVKQVCKYRLQQELGHMPSDTLAKKSFDEGAKIHSSEAIYDEATNIQLGTEYMQYWLDNSSSVEAAYLKYRGKEDAYYSKIKPCSDKLKNDPENVQILHEIH